MALVWEAAVKPLWRPAYTRGDITGSPTKKISMFGETVREGMSDLESGKSLESLAARLSSGLSYFSLVLQEVPEFVPYENGRLILRALEHSVKPRFLFPEKPSLGSNSWLVQNYAGVPVAGDELATSVGLPYLAEFYVDFGVPGLLLCAFILGIFIGSSYSALILICPSYQFFSAAVTLVFLQHFVNYDGEIAYMLSGMLQSLIIFGALLLLAGPWLHRTLLTSSSRRFHEVNERNREES